MYKTILFIEDETFIADLYAGILRQHGFQVTCAYDGETGLKAAQTQKFDLILLDLMLPGTSGEDILSALRDTSLSPDFDQSTDIFVLTNFEEDELTKAKLLTMAQKYLVKVRITPLGLVALLQGEQPTTAITK